MAVFIHEVVDTVNRNLGIFSKTSTISRNQAAVYFSYFLLGSLNSLSEKSPEIYSNMLIFVEQGNEVPMIQLSMSEKSIDKISTQILFVDFNQISHEAVEFSNVEEIILRQSSFSKSSLFDGFRIRVEKFDPFPKITVNEDPQFFLHALQFRNMLINSPNLVVKEKHQFVMNPLSGLGSIWQNNFIRFPEYFQFFHYNIYAERMIAFGNILFRSFDHVSNLYRLLGKTSIMSTFAFFEGLLHFDGIKNNVLVQSFMLEITNPMIHLRFKGQPFTFLISLREKHEFSLHRDNFAEQGIDGYIFMMDFRRDKSRFIRNAEWLHIQPLSLMNFMPKQNNSVGAILTTEIILNLKLKHQMNILDKPLELNSSSSFLLGSVVAEAFHSPKCYKKALFESCFRIDDQFDHLDLMNKITCSKTLKTNTETEPNIWRALKMIVSQCQLRKIVHAYFVAGFISYKFTLCPSSVSNIICFIDADEEKLIFIYITIQSTSLDQFTLIKTQTEFHRIFIKEFISYIPKELGYDLKVLLYIENETFTDILMIECRLDVLDICERTFEAVMTTNNATRSTEYYTNNPAKDINSLLLESYIIMNNAMSTVVNIFGQNYHVKSDESITNAKHLIMSRNLDNRGFIRKDCLIDSFVRSIPEYTDVIPLTKFYKLIHIDFIINNIDRQENKAEHLDQDLLQNFTLFYKHEENHDLQINVQMIKLSNSFETLENVIHSEYSSPIFPAMNSLKVEPFCECKDLKLNATTRRKILLRKMLFVMDHQKFQSYFRPDEYCPQNDECSQPKNDNEFYLSVVTSIRQKATLIVCDVFQYHERLYDFLPLKFHSCSNMLGVIRSTLVQKMSPVLVELGEGSDKIQMHANMSATFLVGSGHKEINSSNMADIFIVSGEKCAGYINGGLGIDSIKFISNSIHTSKARISFKNYRTEVRYSDDEPPFFLYNIENYQLDNQFTMVEVDACEIGTVKLYAAAVLIRNPRCTWQNLKFVIEREARVLVQARSGTFQYRFLNETQTLIVDCIEETRSSVFHQIDFKCHNISNITQLIKTEKSFKVKIGNGVLELRNCSNRYRLQFNDSFILTRTQDRSLCFKASLKLTVSDILNKYRQISMNLSMPMIIYSVTDQVMVFIDDSSSSVHFSSKNIYYFIVGLKIKNAVIVSSKEVSKVFKFMNNYFHSGKPLKPFSTVLNVTIVSNNNQNNDIMIDLVNLYDLVVNQMQRFIRVNIKQQVRHDNIGISTISYRLTFFVSNDNLVGKNKWIIAEIFLRNVTELNLFSCWHLVLDQEYKFASRNLAKVSLVPLTIKVQIHELLVLEAKSWMRFQLKQVDLQNVFSVRDDILLIGDFYEKENRMSNKTTAVLLKGAQQLSDMMIEFFDEQRCFISFKPYEVVQDKMKVM